MVKYRSFRIPGAFSFLLLVICSHMGALAQDRNGRYELSDLVNALVEKGQLLFNVERGPDAPKFSSIDLSSANRSYLDAAGTILNSQGYSFEMRGPVMVIFEKAARTSNENLLNKTIDHLTLGDLTIEECLTKIGEKFGATVFVTDRTPDSPKGVSPKFSVELKDITVRDALFLLAAKRHKTWSAQYFSMGKDPCFSISFE